MDNWSFRSATELVATYRARAASPVEVAREVLERIGKLDREVNAFCLVDADAAIASAGESERRWLRGEPCGPLDGVPTSIKDVLLTRGWPTRRGSRTVDPDQPWDVDAPATARLREAGAVLIGKTTSPEFGWKGVTDSPLTGTTRNPWAPSQTAGGSSGGSAAAVALGLGPLSLGTDGGGSVRIPAAFCGVFALKPTYGRIPHYPPSPFGDLVHVGPITRTVDDAALLLDTLARPDSRDWSALAAPATSFVAALRGGVHGLRVAFSPALGYVTVHPEVAAAVRAAVQVFERLGAGVEEVDPGFANPIDAFTVLWNAGAARLLATVRQSAQHHVDPGLREIGAIGATYTADQYLDAVAQRMDIGSRMGVFHDRYDLLLTPTLPIPAFEAGREAPSGSTDPRWTGWTPFTYPFNLTQQPAATLPCGRTSDGLPIGLQVIAPRHADAMVLAACKAFQDACPSTRDWPPLADSWR